jgi:hypothetical protein
MIANDASAVVSMAAYLHLKEFQKMVADGLPRGVLECEAVNRHEAAVALLEDGAITHDDLDAIEARLGDFYPELLRRETAGPPPSTADIERLLVELARPFDYTTGERLGYIDRQNYLGFRAGRIGRDDYRRIKRQLDQLGDELPF